MQEHINQINTVLENTKFYVHIKSFSYQSRSAWITKYYVLACSQAPKDTLQLPSPVAETSTSTTARRETSSSAQNIKESFLELTPDQYPSSTTKRNINPDAMTKESEPNKRSKV